MKNSSADQETQLIQAQDWAQQLLSLNDLIGRRFPRSEPRQGALTSLKGLLSPLERKNSWQLAQQAGDATPFATQHLLGRARWDADAVRDDLQTYVIDHLADPDSCSSLMKQASLKKATKVQASLANTLAPLVASRVVRSVSSYTGLQKKMRWSKGINHYYSNRAPKIQSHFDVQVGISLCGCQKLAGLVSSYHLSDDGTRLPDGDASESGRGSSNR
jgi:hypothetical protein